MNLKRRDFIKKFSCCCCAPLLLSSCAEVAITNRKQLSFVSEDRINKKAIQAYETIKENENLIFIKDLNLQVENGKVLCVYGKSGVGKSSLINVIAGVHDDNLFFLPQIQPIVLL